MTNKEQSLLLRLLFLLIHSSHLHLAHRSIHIVALGSECPGGVGPGDEIMGQGQLQGGLLWSYLGHGALVGPCDPENSVHNPAFMEYTSRVFGDVTVVVRDCPSWVRPPDRCLVYFSPGSVSDFKAASHPALTAAAIERSPFIAGCYFKPPLLQKNREQKEPNKLCSQ